MKRVFFVLAFFMLVSLGKTYADEGMWLPMFVERLNYTDMQEAGLQLSADEIYSVNNSSLKDAIVGLSTSPTPSGFFCTGEIVSDKGLLFTNHHCGYDIIQQHSNLEHDYLTNGFWAKSLDEELPNEELTASFLIRMEDITDSVLANVTAEMSNQERSAAIREVSSRLKKAAAKDNHYNVVVKSFFNGNEYYMFVYEVFTDVRLVGAPPSAIGKFGGDTDNWMWPRHTGDFSIFRVYTAPDGSPADYAEENIPLKPKHHLPISLDGVQEDDFAMIWGYPGGTDRYLTSYGVDFNLDDQYPTIIELFGKKLEVWKSFMEADQQVKIQYASKYAVTANTWKYLIGQTRGLKKLDVADKKMETEAQFEAWVNADEARKEKYGNVLENLEDSYTKMGSTIEPFLFTNFAGLSGSEIVSYANNFNGLYELLKPIDKKELPKDKDMAKKLKEERAAQVKTTADALLAGLDEHFKNYYAPADQEVLETMLYQYYQNVPVNMQAPLVYQMFNEHKGSFGSYAEEVFKNSVFAEKERLKTFLNDPDLRTLEKDPALELANAFMSKMMETSGEFRAAQATLSESERLFMAGLREMQPNKVFYPDANSTMRMTYGSVQEYEAADAIQYNYLTTSAGILEKEDPTDDEFIVPEYLKNLIETRDFGVYGEDGELIICFLTTNDITGGNSGSPVINGKGELIGIAFDGNWEAMSGDIAFEPALQRTINVDIRYVLFVIDKYAGATNLIDELTIRKSAPEPIRTETVDL
ncbi:MAG: S46 family peptidase [Bacteroidetes bacterium]|jgi:hypothetical protein|nr:S46 family peptidase [Bacteroidota bacterium]